MTPWPLCNLVSASLSTLISHHSPYSPHSSLHHHLHVYTSEITQLLSI